MNPQQFRTVYGEPAIGRASQTNPVAQVSESAAQTCNYLNSGYPEAQGDHRLGQVQMLGVDGQKRLPTFGGNWSRTKYDLGTLETDTRQSTAPLEFRLDPTAAERCNICRAPDSGWIGKQGVSYNTNLPLIDTESELKNITRIHSNNPSYKYIPYCPNCGECTSGSGLPCGEGLTGGCHNCKPQLFHFPKCDLKFEYTRLSNPTCTMRETGKNRFQPSCMNPQDVSRWEHPGEIGINYRMVVKDNHVPCIPFPVDPSEAMPRGGDIPCEMIKPTCAMNITPLHNYYKRQRY